MEGFHPCPLMLGASCSKPTHRAQGTLPDIMGMGLTIPWYTKPAQSPIIPKQFIFSCATYPIRNCQVERKVYQNLTSGNTEPTFSPTTQNAEFLLAY